VPRRLVLAALLVACGKSSEPAAPRSAETPKEKMDDTWHRRSANADASFSFDAVFAEEVVLRPGTQRFVLDRSCSRCDENYLYVSLKFAGPTPPPITIRVGDSIDGGSCDESLLRDVAATTCTLRVFADVKERELTVVNRGDTRTARLNVAAFWDGE
jgi:hypothetical protein